MSKSQEINSNCPMNITINMISGKWKLSILWHLSKEPVRFNELQRKLYPITQKTLTLQLRELEKDAIIYRHIYPECPPRVEYGLTSIGESIKPILSDLCEWGKNYMKLINQSND